MPDSDGAAAVADQGSRLQCRTAAEMPTAGARPAGWRSRSEMNLADVGVVVHREQASAAVFLDDTKRVCAQTAAAV